MRILLLSNIFPPGFIGGYELGALDIAQGLVRRGHEVRVLTSDYFTDDNGEIKDLQVVRTLDSAEPRLLPFDEIETMRRCYFVFPGNIRRLGSELIAWQPDAVLAFNLIGIGVLGTLQFLTTLGTRPAIFAMDNLFKGLSLIPQDGHRRVFGNLDFLHNVYFLMMSRNLHDEIERALGVSLTNVSHVPGWVFPEKDGDNSHNGSDSGQGTRFAFVSRIAGHKGIELILAAAHHLWTEGSRRFCIDIYGAGDIAWLTQQINSLGLASCIRYCGVASKSAVPRILSGYDAMLFPTWEREPFGFIVPEAASVGCIPIMTAGIGAAEWFLDDVDCMKIERNVDSLSAAMLRLMLMSPSQRQMMRQRTRQCGRRHFCFDSVLDKTIEVLKRAKASSVSPSVPAIRRAESALVLLDDLWRPT